MTIRRSIWWVTAGHIIQDIERERSSGNVAISKYRLADHFGTGPDQSSYIPFDYEGADKFFVFDEDNEIDFGFVRIAPFYARTLLKNGILTIPKKDWGGKDSVEYDYFFVIGFPEDEHHPSHVPTNDGYYVRIKPRPSAFYLEPAPKSPKKKSRYPLFTAKVASKDDITGISGGPIFGVTLLPFSARVIAIQAGWDRKSRISFGLLLPTVGKLAEKHIAKL